MNKNFKGSSIGTSLIMVIFVLICLLTFATLSMLSARTDEKLSLSVAENIDQFYKADTFAQMTLKEIDDKLLEIYQQTEKEQEYYSAVYDQFNGEFFVENSNEDGVFLTFVTTVSDFESIVSTIKIEFYNNQENNLYSIQSWKLTNTVDWNTN